MSKLLILLLMIGLGAFSYKTGWTAPERAAQYLPHVKAAEQQHQLPHNLLARLLHQESSYLPEIINGNQQSSAGAIGIAQIIPKWHPNVNPYDPTQSIYYAAHYLSNLHGRFGAWSLALMAYNWGPGNVSKWRRGEINKIPTETRNYVREILSDVEVFSV